MNTTSEINHLRLDRLTLRNFKGIRNFTFEPEGQSVSVYGENETGKTTLADALAWLLFDKDTADRSPDSFGIKTREGGEELHGLEHEVTGVFNGGELTLRKVYKEKWTRKRGAAKEEFSGHTTDHFIDDEPVQKKEYDERVAEIMDEQLFKILTIPTHFPEAMHWTDRREILFELAGPIQTEDIIEGTPELARYPKVLDGKSHEAREKILSERRRKLNKTLDNIPDRIDQETKGLYEDVGDVEQARQTIADLKDKKQTIEAKRSEVDAGGAVADLKVDRQELEAKKAELKNDHKQAVEAALKDARAKVLEIQDKVDEAEAGYRQAKREYEEAVSILRSAKKSIVNTKAEIDQVKAREPKPESEFEPEKCPACERPYEDSEEHNYEKYLQEFNTEKAEKLKELNDILQGYQQEHEQAKADHVEAKEDASIAKGKLNQREDALQRAQKALDEKKDAQQGVEFTDEYQQVCADISEVEKKIENHREEKQAQLQKLDTEIEKLEADIEEAQKTIHRAEENQRTQKRIEELEAERKDTQAQLEQVEEDLHLIEEFVRARSAYVTDRVNEKFEHVSWQLFKEQINGGLTETCDAIYKGVPFGEGLNKAGRIQAGIDIINTLSKHFDRSAPVFVDNAESVIELPDTDLQVIRLVVDEAYEKLTVKPEREPVTA